MNYKYNWDAIRKEYALGASLRSIADRYGMALSTVARRATKEGWEEVRNNIKIKDAVDTMARIAKGSSEQSAKDAEEIKRIARKILTYIEEAIPVAKIQEIRMLSGALKDCREILGIRNDLDVIEQGARIENMKRMAQQDDREVKVIISSAADAYAV